MNSKELTEGNRETRDWKRSSNSNWEQRRSELRVVCLSLRRRKTRNSRTWNCRLEKRMREFVETAARVIIVVVSVREFVFAFAFALLVVMMRGAFAIEI